MKKAIPFFSYLFHPIIIPIITMLMYFLNTYQFYQPIEIVITLGQIAITTFFLPITLYYLLKSMRLLRSSVMVDQLSERLLPFSINIILLILLKNYVLLDNSIYEYKIYLWGSIYTYILLLISLFFKKKYSVHTALLSGSLTFYILLSLHLFLPNIIGIIALTLALGFTASSRLYLKAHTNSDIIMGFLIGVFPQLLFWKLTLL